MIVEIILWDNEGKEVARQKADAMKPAQWKTPYDQPKTEGDYQLFGYAWQPQVRLHSKAGGF